MGRSSPSNGASLDGLPVVPVVNDLHDHVRIKHRQRVFEEITALKREAKPRPAAEAPLTPHPLGDPVPTIEAMPSPTASERKKRPSGNHWGAR